MSAESVFQAFNGEISKLTASRVPGTRNWLLDSFDEWHMGQAGSATQKRAFVLVAGPGIGKSMLCALLCSQRKQAIAAHHFCKYNHSEKASPKRLLRSLAYQLASQLPAALEAFEEAVDELGDINSLGVTELFDRLLLQPLANVTAASVPCGQAVLLIDALDEASAANGRNELIDLIRCQLGSLPDWVRFFITTRPLDERPGVPDDARDLLEPLQRFSPKVWRIEVGRLLHNVCTEE